MTNEPRDLSDQLGRIPMTTAADIAAARRTCAHYATDADDLALVLDVLGIGDDR